MHSANEKSKVFNFTIVKIVQPIEFQIQLFIIDKDYNRERHGNLGSHNIVGFLTI
jgi:hypothetical protein